MRADVMGCFLSAFMMSALISQPTRAEQPMQGRYAVMLRSTARG
ncbi:hypothetical protein [Bradyrhizobium sp. 174]|nr:hypothetical protein [Bradyrhizobium sp. 174]